MTIKTGFTLQIFSIYANTKIYVFKHIYFCRLKIIKKGERNYE